MDIESKSKRIKRRTQLRRQQIADVSAELFARLGYQSTTLDLIAKELGCSKANLYNFVDSKEDVRSLVAANLLNVLKEQVQDATPKELPADERLHQLIFLHVRMIATHPEIIPLTNVDRSKEEDILIHQYELFIRGIIQQGIDEGIFPETDTNIVGNILINMMTNDWCANKSIDYTLVAERISQIFIGGLKNPNIGS